MYYLRSWPQALSPFFFVIVIINVCKFYFTPAHLKSSTYPRSIQKAWIKGKCSAAEWLHPITAEEERASSSNERSPLRAASSPCTPGPPSDDVMSWILKQVAWCSGGARLSIRSSPPSPSIRQKAARKVRNTIRELPVFFFPYCLWTQQHVVHKLEQPACANGWCLTVVHIVSGLQGGMIYSCCSHMFMWTELGAIHLSTFTGLIWFSSIQHRVGGRQTMRSF